MKEEIQEGYLEEAGSFSRWKETLGFGHAEKSGRAFKERKVEPGLELVLRKLQGGLSFPGQSNLRAS